LAGNYEFRLGVLSYLLRTYGYAVTTADTADEAEQLMLQTPVWFDLLLITWPLKGAEALLKRAKVISPGTGTLAVAQDDDLAPLRSTADATISSSQYSSDAILERVGLLTARRRGPRPQPKLAPEMKESA
jgi:response regulator RpfG family c-di-GMP phosphodiesterase